MKKDIEFKSLQKDVLDIATHDVRVLTVVSFGPTRTKGARVEISDKHFNKSITIPADSSKWSGPIQTAVAYLLSKGWPVESTHKGLGLVIMREWDETNQLR